MHNNCIMCASKWCWKSGKYDENTCTGFTNRTITTYSNRTTIDHAELKKMGLPYDFSIRVSSDGAMICEGLTKEQEEDFRNYLNSLMKG